MNLAKQRLSGGKLVLCITALARVPGHGAEWISRVLDGGAQGVIVPHVNDGAQAKAIVGAARKDVESLRNLA